MVHQHQRPPEQVAHRTQLRVVDVLGRENLQGQKFGQEERVMSVVGMFDPVALLHAGGLANTHLSNHNFPTARIAVNVKSYG